jgi:hypothetical protein
MALEALLLLLLKLPSLRISLPATLHSHPAGLK